MELFYTVISQPQNAQSNPLNSLGGFCSSSKVQSGEFNALFGDVSSYTLKAENAEYIALMLKNTLGYDVKDLKFWIVPDPEAIFDFRIALTSPNIDGGMESVPTINTKPLYAEFFNPRVDDPLEIDGIFEADMELGIWIERKINPQSPQVSRISDCNYLYDLYKEKKTLPQTEVFELKVSWEIV